MTRRFLPLTIMRKRATPKNIELKSSVAEMSDSSIFCSCSRAAPTTAGMLRSELIEQQVLHKFTIYRHYNEDTCNAEEYIFFLNELLDDTLVKDGAMCENTDVDELLDDLFTQDCADYVHRDSRCA